MSSYKRKVLITFLLVVGLIISSGTAFSAAADDITSTSLISNNTMEGSDTATQTIKILIYNGDKVANDSVAGIESVLDSANSGNLVPGYKFTYSTSKTIDSTVLSSYDLLVMPGGNDYIINYDGKTIDSIDAAAIKNFISGGKGYLGICAGAFAGAKYTENCYYGWGIAPNITCIQPYSEINTTITITAAGKQILGQDDPVTTLYWNGPAMTASGNALVLATYDGITISTGKVIISSGMAAIVADYYGQGRSVLMGPHPELEPKSPGLIAKLIVWAANIPPISTAPLPDDITPPSDTPLTPSNTTITQPIAAANTNNNTIPLQGTGTPLIPLAMAILTGTGGILLGRMGN
ncbi:MAG: hypothetical protein A4E27_01492 [Methanobacterium sp. PtaU1.Bin242]|nr:MAG: hypothetical protein A4E27_01492 [Methanobacterium sp. PtaU1.Bin242]